MKFDEAIKREIIMDNYQRPAHHGLIEDASYLKIHMASESCIDDLHIQLKVVDHKIVDGRFDGVACAISTSSTSMMLKLIMGKSVEEAKHLINEYTKMVQGEAYESDELEEANALDTLYKQANRIKCGLIGVQGVMSLIQESEAQND